MEQAQKTGTNDVLSIALLKEMERMLDDIQTIDMRQIMDFLMNRLTAGLNEPLFPFRYDLGTRNEVDFEDVNLELVDSYFNNIASISPDAIKKVSAFKKRIIQSFSEDEIIK